MGKNYLAHYHSGLFDMLSGWMSVEHIKKRQELAARGAFLKEFTNACCICRFLFLRGRLHLDDNVRGKVGHVIGDEVLCLSYT